MARCWASPERSSVLLPFFWGDVQLVWEDVSRRWPRGLQLVIAPTRREVRMRARASRSSCCRAAALPSRSPGDECSWSLLYALTLRSRSFHWPSKPCFFSSFSGPGGIGVFLKRIVALRERAGGSLGVSFSEAYRLPDATRGYAGFRVATGLCIFLHKRGGALVATRAVPGTSCPGLVKNRRAVPR
ncbi:hypothetical protein LZ30DRAFT_207663 [Colletotrichum cereale]|nr:hypothetical protein LZ30DRAFT_207663 [Colletotrichum cereale]